MIIKVLRKIKNYLLRVQSAFIHFISKPNDLIILDDIFPHLLSGFRVAEFNYYLENISKSKVYSTANAFKWIHEERTFEVVKKEHALFYPSLKKMIVKYDGQRIKAKLFYFTFLRNTYEFLPIINKHKTPFIFTLYPGGNFRLDQEESDLMLKAIFSNPYFRKVIVTSKATLEYLEKKKLCSKENIEIIYGVVTQSNLFDIKNEQILKKTLSQTFDICFVAHKYSPMGKDKGYDVFIETAKILLSNYPNIFFHVVGNFDKTDVDVSSIENNVKFYGTLNTQEFSSFYATIDIIMSPNSSFILSPGAFDGFPTGACIEAGLNGVALFISDDIKQNVFFKNGEDVILINSNFMDIAEIITYYYLNPDKLKEISIAGQEKIKHHYNIQAQMLPRIALIKKELENIR